MIYPIETPYEQEKAAVQLQAICLDRSSLTLTDSLDSRDDVLYWWSRTPEERLQHVERLRRINYGHLATGRLQRVLTIVER